jgi:hypothetical protein
MSRNTSNLGQETDFGRYKLPHNAIRVLATQAYMGKRKEMFRQEFLLALKILQDGQMTLADMRASRAGTMGLAQSCRRNFTSTESISTATVASTSSTRCPTRSPPRPSNSSTRVGSRAGAGPTKFTRLRTRLHARRAGGDEIDRQMAPGRLCAGLRPQAAPRRAC